MTPSVDLPPAPGLYIHIPWCLRKCPYCDFNSHAAGGTPPFDAYVDAVLLDLTAEAKLLAGVEVASLFIGGGTPSLMPAEELARLLEGVARRLVLAEGVEITLEANPGAAEASRFAAYRAAGVNRLSIGVQSFDDASLRALERVHDGLEAERAVRAARAAGFERINIDLMHGLPGQTPEGAVADLERAIAFEPQQISWYQLTLEPNTRFHARPPSLPDEESLWAIQEAGAEVLERAGFRPYEISAWAPPGGECRHNLNYWRFGDYIGIGAGAHGKRSIRDPAAPLAIERYSKRRNPRDYLAAAADGAFRSRTWRVAPEERVLEFMMNAMRLRAGVTFELFERRTGLPRQTLAPVLSRLEARGMVVVEAAGVRPTALGRRFLNELLEAFVTE